MQVLLFLWCHRFGSIDFVQFFSLALFYGQNTTFCGIFVGLIGCFHFQVTGGVISLSLGIDEVYTLTTLKSGAKGEYPSPPPQKPFPLPYIDDFECK